MPASERQLKIPRGTAANCRSEAGTLRVPQPAETRVTRAIIGRRARGFRPPRESSWWLRHDRRSPRAHAAISLSRNGFRGFSTDGISSGTITVHAGMRQVATKVSRTDVTQGFSIHPTRPCQRCHDIEVTDDRRRSAKHGRATDAASIEELLDRAVAAINRGDRAAATALAGQVLAADGSNA